MQKQQLSISVQGAPSNISQNHMINKLAERCAICNGKLNDVYISDKIIQEEFMLQKFGTCNICCRIFTQVDELLQHKRIHYNEQYGENHIACVQCTIVNHLFKILPGKVSNHRHSLFCEICTKTFHGKYEYYKHRRDHFDRVVFNCARCDIKITGQKRYQLHTLYHTKNEMQMYTDCSSTSKYGVQCTICKVNIQDISALEQNILQEADKKTDAVERKLSVIMCNICCREYASGDHLLDHQRSHFDGTGDEINFGCFDCLDKQDVHLSCKHGGVGQFVQKDTYCEKCNELFENTSEASNHKTTHFDRVTYKCEFCQQFFIGQSMFCAHLENKHKLSVHKENTTIHQQPKFQKTKIICDICKSVFYNYMYYKNHVVSKECIADNDQYNEVPPTTISSGLMVYICAICDAEFKSRLIWQAHSKNHLKVYICSICNENFVDISQLKAHNSIHYTTTSTQTDCSDVILQFKEKDTTDSIKSFGEIYIGPDVEANDAQWSSLATKREFDELSNSENELEIRNNVQVHITEIKKEHEYFFNELSNDSVTGLQDSLISVSNEIDTIKKENIEEDDRIVLETNTRSRTKSRKKCKSTKVLKPINLGENSNINCAMCGGEVKDLWQSDEHILEEIRQKQVCTCKICGRFFRSISSLQGHHQSHVDTNINPKGLLVACENCISKEKRFDIKIGEDTTNKYKCERCPRTYPDVNRLRTHTREHLDRSVYYCDFCSKHIVGHSRYIKHAYRHKMIRPKQKLGTFECHYCGKIFRFKTTIVAHVKGHVVADRFNCHLCPASLKTKGNLKQHIITQHGGTKNLTCDVCGKAFFRQLNLTHHMRSHTGERPYPCTVCGKAFGHRGNVENHMRIHTGEKPYKCKHCDKCYRDFSDLRRHIRIHGGIDKKHQCEICEKKFYEMKHLRAHKLSAHSIA